MIDLAKETARADTICLRIGRYRFIDHSRELDGPVVAARLALAWNVLDKAEALAKAVEDENPYTEIPDGPDQLVRRLARALLAEIAAGEGSGR